MKLSDVEVEEFLLDFDNARASKASSVAVAFDSTTVTVPTDFSIFCFFFLISNSNDGSK